MTTPPPLGEPLTGRRIVNPNATGLASHMIVVNEMFIPVTDTPYRTSSVGFKVASKIKY